MAVTPWEDNIKKRKVLTVFHTNKVSGEWLRTFNDAIAKFNELSSSKRLSLGVTLAAPSNVTRPDPVGEGGAEVQFDLGNGQLKIEAGGQNFVAEDEQGNPINFSPLALHGYTGQVKQSFGGQDRIRRAFIFVPETPMVTAPMRVGPDKFKHVQRPAGSGIRLYIAVHEFIHACGLSNQEHNSMGPDADVFTSPPDTSPGDFNKPEDDKILLRVNPPHPNVYAPPITIKKKVADMIRDNWK